MASTAAAQPEDRPQDSGWIRFVLFNQNPLPTVGRMVFAGTVVGLVVGYFQAREDAPLLVKVHDANTQRTLMVLPGEISRSISVERAVDGRRSIARLITVSGRRVA